MVGIRKFKATTFLALALLTAGIEGEIKPSVKVSLQKIKTSLTSEGDIVQDRVDKISTYLDSGDVGSDVEKLSSSIDKIGGAVSSLTSGDPAKIVGGTLDVIEAVTSVIPMGGPIISDIFSLFGSIFGAVGGGGGDDVATIVAREIKKALDKYEDEELRAEAAGAERVFSVLHAYLDSKRGGAPITQYEIGALAANVPVYENIDFLGKLASRIKDDTKSNDPNDVKRAMTYTHLYVILAVLRSATLWELYSVLRSAPDAAYTAGAVHRVIKTEIKNDFKFLNFFKELDYSHATFAAYFNPSEWPTIMQFLKKQGIDYQRLPNLAAGEYVLSPKKWPDSYMYMRGDYHDYRMGYTHHIFNGQAKFTFHPVSSVDNVFHIRPVEWPEQHMYMTDDLEGVCYGRTGEPGPAGEWKVMRFKDGRYMLSPRKYPNWFIYMDWWGDIRGYKGDPGSEGHWNIKRI